MVVLEDQNADGVVTQTGEMALPRGFEPLLPT